MQPINTVEVKPNPAFHLPPPPNTTPQHKLNPLLKYFLKKIKKN
jgi:hypothetical protein